MKTSYWSIVVNLFVSECTDPHQWSKAVGGIQNNERMKKKRLEYKKKK